MPVTSWGLSDEYGRLVDKTGEARLEFFRTLGEPDEDVWFPIINPAFQGGPAWPTRPAWHRIRATSQTIVSSSGLSDPIDEFDGPNIGYGVETALATTDDIPDPLNASWLMELTQAISHQAAVDDKFYARAERFGSSFLALLAFPRNTKVGQIPPGPWDFSSECPFRA